MKKNTTTNGNDRHSQNDCRNKMLARDWIGCHVRITWSAIGGVNGRTGRVTEALRAKNSIDINAWIELDDPITTGSGLEVRLIPVTISGACDQLEILTPRGGR